VTKRAKERDRKRERKENIEEIEKERKERELKKRAKRFHSITVSHFRHHIDTTSRTAIRVKHLLAYSRLAWLSMLDFTAARNTFDRIRRKVALPG